MAAISAAATVKPTTKLTPPVPSTGPAAASAIATDTVPGPVVIGTVKGKKVTSRAPRLGSELPSDMSPLSGAFSSNYA